VIRKIKIDRVKAVGVNRDRGCFFVVRGSWVEQYSANGLFVRKLDVGEEISAITMPPSVWFTEIVAVVGTQNGKVLFLGIRQEDCCLVVVKEERIGDAAIATFAFNEDGRRITVGKLVLN
jgi:hypothetical protein